MLVYAPRGAEGYFVVCLLVKLATHAITLSNPCFNNIGDCWDHFTFLSVPGSNCPKAFFPIFAMHFKCILVELRSTFWVHSGCTAPSAVHHMRERDAAAGRRVMQDKDRKRRRDPLIS